MSEYVVIVASEKFIQLALWNPGEVVKIALFVFLVNFRKAAPMVSVEEVRSDSFQRSIAAVLFLSNCKVSQSMHLWQIT